MAIGQDRRAEVRRTADIAVVVRVYGRSPFPGVLQDISPGGAMLRTNTSGLNVGDEVVIRFNDIEVVATIAWRKGRFSGLSFHRRLVSREMLTMRIASLA